MASGDAPEIPTPTQVPVPEEDELVQLVDLVKTKKVEKMDQEGKLWREVISSNGSGDPGICNGMEIKVHYKGSLKDGTIFDENKEGQPPFGFTVGESSVIPGWDQGVLGLHKGDVVKLYIHSDLAYKDTGTGNIPGKSTLIFEITIVDYKPEDLTKGKTGEILRFNVKAPVDKWVNPNHGSEVKVLIEGKHPSTGALVFPQQTLTFRLGEGCDHGVPYGVEKALYKFRRGEGSKLLIKGSKYNLPADHVEMQKLGLNPNDVVEFYVELVANENTKEPWQLDGPEKLVEARRLKETGNRFFGQALYKLAHKNYKLIIDHLKAEALLEGEEEEERKKLLLAAYLNMAICNLKLNKGTLAIRNCDDALELDHSNAKAFFRRGQAYLTINMPEAAKTDFEKLLQLEPSNTLASQQLAICEKKLKENLKQEKQMYSKMFGNMTKSSKESSTVPNGMENVSEWQNQNGNAS